MATTGSHDASRHAAVRDAVTRMDYAYAESLLTQSEADGKYRRLVVAARRLMAQDVYEQTDGFMERIASRDRVRTRRSTRLDALEYATDTCVVCMEYRSIVTLLPCLHRCLCARCNIDLISLLLDGNVRTTLKCPVCRAYVDGERVWD
jgi:hypothetical protein